MSQITDVLNDWANRIDADGTQSQIVSAAEIREFIASQPAAALSAQGGVKVKELEWVKPPLSETLSRCDTELGTYRTWTHHEANGKWFWSLEGGCNEVAGEANTESAVQAAAQADYDARIRSALSTTLQEPVGEPVKLPYKNYRGETALRTITPKHIHFGSTEWHPEPQWLLCAFDHDKQADRDFALKDFGSSTLAHQPVTAGLESADKLADKIEDLIAEFDKEALPIIAEYLSERRHNLAALKSEGRNDG